MRKRDKFSSFAQTAISYFHQDSGTETSICSSTRWLQLAQVVFQLNAGKGKANIRSLFPQKIFWSKQWKPFEESCLSPNHLQTPFSSLSFPLLYTEQDWHDYSTSPLPFIILLADVTPARSGNMNAEAHTTFRCQTGISYETHMK